MGLQERRDQPPELWRRAGLPETTSRDLDLLEIVPWYPKSASKYSIMGLGSISSSSCRGKRVCRACLVSRWMMQDPQEEDDFALVVPLTPLGTDLLCSVRMIRIFSPHLLDTCMNEEIDK